MTHTLDSALTVAEKYSWLLNSYVLDYFTDHHWDKLPCSWKEALDNVEPQELDHFLNHSISLSYSRVWPLSLLALHRVSMLSSIRREPVQLKSIFDAHLDERGEEAPHCCAEDKLSSEANSCSEWRIAKITPYLTHPRLQYVFTKHVKPKKQHEISRMAQVTASIAEKENCQYVVDIGSGLGHLARVLAYGYGLKACCLEAQENLSHQARKLDIDLEASVSKIINDDNMVNSYRPVHLNITLDSKLDAEIFTEELKQAFGISDDNFRFGIIGLHPCGDLAPILMKLFIQSPNAKFINIVGCCYMKLTTENVSGFRGYPMSRNVSTKPHSLSYEAREIACHAIEAYSERLRHGQFENLKVHCYRAVLEKILVKHWPHLKHTMIKSIKHTTELTFTQYITTAFTKLGLEIPEGDLTSDETNSFLLQWKRVVIFYTLRLMLAPLVETILLLDRLLYLQELDVNSVLVPFFDPYLSPRNYILIGRKKS